MTYKILQIFCKNTKFNRNVEQIRHRRVFVAGSGRDCEVQNQRRVTVAPPTPLKWARVPGPWFRIPRRTV